jgi:hypothetical protein
MRPREIPKRGAEDALPPVFTEKSKLVIERGAQGGTGF